MLIRELAQQTNVAPHTIRFYEKEGLIDDRFFERGENNYRYYQETAVERIMMIKHGQAAGFSLSEIRGLMEIWDAGKLMVNEQIVYIEQKIQEVTQKITELEHMKRYLSDKVHRLHAAPLPVDETQLA